MEVKKINLSIITRILIVGEIQIKSWKRKKNNSIQDQTQNWLFGKEYFYSHSSQKKRTDEKELNRRKNQDEVRDVYQRYIREYLGLYRQIATCIKQFIPNYSATEFDNFKLQKSIDRIFEYHLVHKDFDSSYRTKHNYEKIVNPTDYWKTVIAKGITKLNFDDLTRNYLISTIFPEFQTYRRLRKSLTGWYVRKLIDSKEWLTKTSFVFYSSYKYRDLPIDKLCKMIYDDFKIKSGIAEYQNMFKMFGITKELLKLATDATLNQKGRQDWFTAWFEQNKHRWIREYTAESFGTRNFHLDILGIETGADIQEIKSAYRKLSLKCHPDIIGGDGQEFIKITKSYHYLTRKV